MKKLIEISLIKLASWILDRNVERAMQISRRDNNKIFVMQYELKRIAKRMKNNYK